MVKTAAEKMAALEAEIEKLKQKEKLRKKAEVERKKYLIGDFIYRSMMKTGISASDLTFESHSFNDWLTAKVDRDLFGLVTEKNPTSSAQ